MPNYDHDVFLSHHSSDKPVVRALAGRLRDAGFKVWFDEWSIAPGEDINLAIEKGLEQSRCVVLAMSQAAFESDWVSAERSTAAFRDPTNKERRFLPLLLEDCEIPETVQRFKYLDWRNASERALEQLIEAVWDNPEPTPGEEKEHASLKKIYSFGHAGSVMSVAWSPCGKLVLSGSTDKTVRVWEVASSRCIATLEGHSNSVMSVAWSPDGKRALSGSSDNTIRVWEVANGQCMATLEDHSNSVTSVAWSPEGKRALSGSLDKTVKVWEIDSWRCIATFDDHTSCVRSVAWSPNGKRAISGSEDRTVKIWSIDSGQCLATLEGHTSYVLSVAWSPDGERVLSGACDNTLKVWEIASGRCLATLEKHTSYVRSVAWSPDGERVISGSEDRTVRIWKINRDEPLLATLQGHSFYVMSVAWSPDGKRVLSGSEDRTIRLWKVENRQWQPALESHTDSILSVAWSPNGKLIISGSEDKDVRIWRVKSGQCLIALSGHSASVLSVAWSPDGKKLLSGSNDMTARIWETDSGRCLATLEGHSNSVMSVAWAPDGKRVLSSSNDNTARLWEIESGRCLAILEDHSSFVWSVAWSPDGTRALSGSDDKTVKVWEADSGQCLATFEGHLDSVRTVAWSPDGTRALSGSDDKTVRLWETSSGQCLATFEGHSDSVRTVAWSPEGRRALSGSDDNTVRLWDIETGECLVTLRGHSSRVTSIAWSSNGKDVFSAAINAVMRQWTLGEEAREFADGGKQKRYANAKIVLLGKSGVGKSGLAYRLIEDRFVETHSTHGMHVWRLDLPIAEDETVEREALLWDLAGQEDYRLIHQLFLEETALALVLVNPQSEDPFSEAIDWIKALEQAMEREPNKLLIASRIDCGSLRISTKKVKDFVKENGFLGYIETSAMRGDSCSDRQANGVSELKQLIAQQIPWSRLPFTSTPKLLAAIRNAVLDMKELDSIQLLRFNVLVQRLRQRMHREAFEPQDVREAVTLLANHGLAMPFAFGDLVLLRPELLNGYASRVILSARANTDEIGCVLEEDLYSPDFDWAGIDPRLNRPDESLMLRALVQTFLEKSLCILEEIDGKNHLIFPSQYRREKSFPGDPDIFVSYTFTGEPQTLYTTLVVRLWYSKEFSNKELWKDAVEFTVRSDRVEGSVAGLRLLKTGEGEGTFQIFFDESVTEANRISFIQYVHKHLQKHAKGKFTRDRRYKCPACLEPVTNIHIVRHRLEAGKDFIFCQACDERVPLIDSIERQVISDPVAKRVIGMDRIATERLDKLAREQILIGHLLAICGEANQIFRLLPEKRHGLDSEIEFRDREGKPSGQKIFLRLSNERDEDYYEDWRNYSDKVYLIVRPSKEEIRWINAKDQREERLDVMAIWRVWDRFFPRSTK